MGIATVKQSKRVSFNEDVSVDYIPPLDEQQIKDIYYDSYDYERFRFEQDMDIEQNLRKKQQPTLRRATRRCSIDLMVQKYSPPSCGPPSQTEQETQVPEHSEVQTRVYRRQTSSGALAA